MDYVVNLDSNGNACVFPTGCPVNGKHQLAIREYVVNASLVLLPQLERNECFVAGVDESVETVTDDVIVGESANILKQQTWVDTARL